MKKTKTSTKKIFGIVGIGIFILVAFTAVAIALRQRYISGPAAPNAPISKPSADVGDQLSCTYGFFIEEPTPTPAPPACGDAGCEVDSDCGGGLVCATISDGSKYCAIPEYVGRCATALPEDVLVNCCTPPDVTPTPFITPTATPTPPICENCGYQVDVFWGPVIQSFASNPETGEKVRYHNNPNGNDIYGHRFLDGNSSKGRVDEYPACSLADNDYIPYTQAEMDEMSFAGIPEECWQPVEKGYFIGLDGSEDVNFESSEFRWQFLNLEHLNYEDGGYVTAYVKVKDDLPTDCKYRIGLASYKADSSEDDSWNDFIESQNLLDHTETYLGPGEDTILILPLEVSMPELNDTLACYDSVDIAGILNMTSGFTGNLATALFENAVFEQSDVNSISIKLTNSTLFKRYVSIYNNDDVLGESVEIGPLETVNLDYQVFDNLELHDISVVSDEGSILLRSIEVKDLGNNKVLYSNSYTLNSVGVDGFMISY